MSKRVSNSKGMATGNRGIRNNRHNNYMTRLREAGNTAKSVDAIQKIRDLFMEARSRFNQTRLVPKGSTKILASLVRQRT